MLTGVTVDVDQSAYSRYDQACNTITAHVAWTGAAGGELLAITLVRMDGYGTLWASAPSPVAAGAGWLEVSIPLEACTDTNGFYRGHSGWYTVVATDGTTDWPSAPFGVSIVSVNRIRNGILRGLPLTTSETVGILDQPRVITGVTITDVDAEHHRDAFTLTYDPTAHTLSWGGGPAVSIQGARWNSTVTLFLPGTTSYVRAQLRPNLLPAGSTPVSETLVVDRKHVTDQDILQAVWQAETEVEAEVHVPLSPVQGATPYAAQAFPGFYDRELLPVHWEMQRDPYRWLHITLPINWVQRIDHLMGTLNNELMVQVGADLIDLSGRQGLVTLLPRQGAVIEWQFANGFFFPFLFGGQSTPDFWQYTAVWGARDLRTEKDGALVLEAVEKKAALETLVIAGLAAKPGVASETEGRDGVSAGTVYARGKGGPFADVIGQYNDWLKEWLLSGRVYRRMVGPKMFTL